MSKKKIILRSILIVFTIIFVILVIHTVWNFIIISNIEEKISKYVYSDNFSLKIVSTQNDGTIVKTSVYKKGDKKVSFIEREKDGQIVKISMYDTNGAKHTYIDTNDSKIVILNGGMIEVNIYSIVETKNILVSFLADIKIVNENGKNYYQLKHTFLPNLMSNNDDIILIDPDTGLIYKSITESSTATREYEFNSVNDEVFIEPDISLYKINEN